MGSAVSIAAHTFSDPQPRPTELACFFVRDKQVCNLDPRTLVVRYTISMKQGCNRMAQGAVYLNTPGRPKSPLDLRNIVCVDKAVLDRIHPESKIGNGYAMHASGNSWFSWKRSNLFDEGDTELQKYCKTLDQPNILGDTYYLLPKIVPCFNLPPNAPQGAYITSMFDTNEDMVAACRHRTLQVTAVLGCRSATPLVLQD